MDGAAAASHDEALHRAHHDFGALPEALTTDAARRSHPWHDRRSSRAPVPQRTVWCSTGAIRLGSSALPPQSPWFDEQPASDRAQIAFLRSTVELWHDGQPRPFVADPTMAVFLDAGRGYRRRAVSSGGDCRDWVEIDETVLRPLLRTIHPDGDDQEAARFPFSHARCDAASYRLLRLATMHARLPTADPLRVEELVLRALVRPLRDACGTGSAAPVPVPAERAHQLADRVRRRLADRHDEPLSLTQLAAEVACSPFHLCRLFKLATGMTLHRYRTELRLRAALELVAEPRIDLTEVALELGFSAHSHFTNAFRSVFGEPPSAFRRHANVRRVAATARGLAPAAYRL